MPQTLKISGVLYGLLLAALCTLGAQEGDRVIKGPARTTGTIPPWTQIRDEFENKPNPDVIHALAEQALKAGQAAEATIYLHSVANRQLKLLDAVNGVAKAESVQGKAENALLYLGDEATFQKLARQALSDDHVIRAEGVQKFRRALKAFGERALPIYAKLLDDHSAALDRGPGGVETVSQYAHNAIVSYLPILEFEAFQKNIPVIDCLLQWRAKTYPDIDKAIEDALKPRGEATTSSPSAEVQTSINKPPQLAPSSTPQMPPSNSNVEFPEGGAKKNFWLLVGISGVVIIAGVIVGLKLLRR
jgi:hypothetical protein